MSFDTHTLSDKVLSTVPSFELHITHFPFPIPSHLHVMGSIKTNQAACVVRLLNCCKCWAGFRLQLRLRWSWSSEDEDGVADTDTSLYLATSSLLVLCGASA